MVTLPMASGVHLSRLIKIADGLAVALAVSLPWSTSATSILLVLWLIALIPTLAWSDMRRELTTAVGGLPELLGDGAELVAPDDVAALDQAVRGLLADPAARRALADRGREQARTWPTETDTLHQVEGLYAELLGQRRR